jgi:hypothetical protein
MRHQSASFYVRHGGGKSAAELSVYLELTVAVELDSAVLDKVAGAEVRVSLVLESKRLLPVTLRAGEPPQEQPSPALAGRGAFEPLSDCEAVCRAARRDWWTRWRSAGASSRSRLWSPGTRR